MGPDDFSKLRIDEDGGVSQQNGIEHGRGFIQSGGDYRLVLQRPAEFLLEPDRPRRAKDLNGTLWFAARTQPTSRSPALAECGLAAS